MAGDADRNRDFLFVMTMCLAFQYLKQNRRRKRRMWVRQIYENRHEYGEFHTLVKEMESNDPEMLFRYFRMTKDSYQELLKIVENRITHSSLRKPISPSERLCITLRFLATGNSIASLSYSFRVARSTISNIIAEVSKVIWEELHQLVLPQPSEEKWNRIIDDFWNKWNFPNCCGAIDGRHIRIQCPPNSGTEFFNYKNYFSINLMAACDANYSFTMVSVGCSGRNSDGGVLQNSAFGQKLYDEALGIPKEKVLPYTETTLPVVFVADEAFPLRRNLMRPFPRRDLLAEPERVFNYRLSRARRVIENSFGILVTRWRCLRSELCLKVDTADYVTLACCCLHNFMRRRELHLPAQGRMYCPTGFVDQDDRDGNVIPGAWREEVTELNSLGQQASNNHSRNAAHIREAFRDYFMQPSGEIEWQYAVVNRNH